MFQFGRFPSVTYVFSYGSTVLHRRGCPIRKSAGQRLFPSHRGLSQVITSFIGSQCQGIHLTLFFAWTAVCYSPILLFRVLLGIFSFFCLSFANNCFLGCKLKAIWFYNSLLLSVVDNLLSTPDEIVTQILVRKNLYNFITSFSRG